MIRGSMLLVDGATIEHALSGRVVQTMSIKVTWLSRVKQLKTRLCFIKSVFQCCKNHSSVFVAVNPTIQYRKEKLPSIIQQADIKINSGFKRCPKIASKEMFQNSIREQASRTISLLPILLNAKLPSAKKLSCFISFLQRRILEFYSIDVHLVKEYKIGF